ncbi:hypothetical protein B0H16DRAFT_1791677 [Mycena metata]|uniref:Uncharacterized protein n=1 Tax=Mycena metata TaxID=1033252 RepID=A0AAD7HJL0_9AGAR|nr:hypothetical protein B0H16DRAFT_1791677 [Mycena metata]
MSCISWLYSHHDTDTARWPPAVRIRVQIEGSDRDVGDRWLRRREGDTVGHFIPWVELAIVTFIRNPEMISAVEASQRGGGVSQGVLGSLGSGDVGGGRKEGEAEPFDPNKLALLLPTTAHGITDAARLNSTPTLTCLQNGLLLSQSLYRADMDRAMRLELARVGMQTILVLRSDALGHTEEQIIQSGDVNYMALNFTPFSHPSTLSFNRVQTSHTSADGPRTSYHLFHTHPPGFAATHPLRDSLTIRVLAIPVVAGGGSPVWVELMRRDAGMVRMDEGRRTQEGSGLRGRARCACCRVIADFGMRSERRNLDLSGPRANTTSLIRSMAGWSSTIGPACGSREQSMDEELRGNVYNMVCQVDRAARARPRLFARIHRRRQRTFESGGCVALIVPSPHFSPARATPYQTISDAQRRMRDYITRAVRWQRKRKRSSGAEILSHPENRTMSQTRPGQDEGYMRGGIFVWSGGLLVPSVYFVRASICPSPRRAHANSAFAKRYTSNKQSSEQLQSFAPVQAYSRWTMLVETFYERLQAFQHRLINLPIIQAHVLRRTTVNVP